MKLKRQGESEKEISEGHTHTGHSLWTRRRLVNASSRNRCQLDQGQWGRAIRSERQVEKYKIASPDKKVKNHTRWEREKKKRKVNVTINQFMHFCSITSRCWCVHTSFVAKYRCKVSLGHRKVKWKWKKWELSVRKKEVKILPGCRMVTTTTAAAAAATLYKHTVNTKHF